MIGRTLGHYEIIEPLGAGGMGEVYRAHDTTLKRDVAIKVLPEDLSADVERLARLEREAQLLAALNHPNIEVIHGLEESDGIRFMVLELIEGESLAETLSRGRIEVERALGIARQIAEALEAAHAKGIIHRDLKPGNIVITPEGQAKVLDFGLAKSNEADGVDVEVSPDLTESPTVAVATMAGIILGTAAYMSPEQARGKPLDKRTDIWSFGCVLYEMLTGRRPFDGETVTDVLAAIVGREPDWAAVPDDAPLIIQLLLRQCLEKDPYRRLHDIADARIDIVNAINEPEGGLPGVAPVAVQTPLWRRAIPWGAGLAVGAVVAGFAVWDLMRPTPGPPWKFEIDLPDEASLSLTGNSLALSPDGNSLVFVAREGGIRQLYLRPMDQLRATPIPGTEGALRPFFSPDGQWVAFNAEGNLKKVSLAGGSPFNLCEGCVSAGATGDWGPPDDTIIFSDGGSLWQIPGVGGEPVLVAEPDREKGETRYTRPKILPGGGAVLFEISRGSLRLSGGIAVGNEGFAVLNLDTRVVEVVSEEGRGPRYAKTGHLIYRRGNLLFAVPFDLRGLRVTGPSTSVLQGVLALGGDSQFSFSLDGTLAYLPGTGDAGNPARRLVWVDRQGASHPVTDKLRAYRIPRLSPDGERVAVEVDQVHIWILEIQEDTLQRLTTEGEVDARFRFAVWTPDGAGVVFDADWVAADNNISWAAADFSGDAVEFLDPEYNGVPMSFSSSGQLAFYENHPTEQRNILVLPTDGEPPRYLVRTPFNERSAVVSPDGRWFAYVSDRSDRDEVYVEPFPDGGQRRQVSDGGGTEPQWAPGGRELFYRNGEQMIAVPVTTDPEFDLTGERKILFEIGAYVTSEYSANYDVHPDGQRFLMVEEVAGGDTYQQINVTLNWFEELKRLVPTGR